MELPKQNRIHILRYIFKKHKNTNILTKLQILDKTSTSGQRIQILEKSPSLESKFWTEIQNLKKSKF